MANMDVPTDATFEDKEGNYSPNSPGAEGPRLLRSQQYDTALRDPKHVPKPLFPKSRPQSVCSRTKILIASAVLVIVLLLIVVLPLALTLGSSSSKQGQKEKHVDTTAPKLLAKLTIDAKPDGSEPSVTLYDALKMQAAQQKTKERKKRQAVDEIATVPEGVPDAKGAKGPSTKDKSQETPTANKDTRMGEESKQQPKESASDEIEAIPRLKKGNEGTKEGQKKDGEIEVIEIVDEIPDRDKIVNIEEIVVDLGKGDGSSEGVDETIVEANEDGIVKAMAASKIIQMLKNCTAELQMCKLFDCTNMVFDTLTVKDNSISADIEFNLIPIDNEAPVLYIYLQHIRNAETKLNQDIKKQFGQLFPKFKVDKSNIALDISKLCDEDKKLKHVKCINDTVPTSPTTQSTTPTTVTPKPTPKPTTAKSDVLNCTGTGFMCKSGEEVSKNQMCDGWKDCTDGSDEMGCTDCKTSFWCPLENGLRQCKRGKVLCDHVNDCGENKLDEQLYCKTNCESFEYKCHGENICVPKSFLCDGDPQCPEEDDELNCTPRTCSNNARWCEADKLCIASWQWCDGTRHCSDGADELQCGCNGCNGQHAKLCAGFGQCINKAQLCDGHQDCPLNQDEIACPGYCEPELPVERMICQDGKLYPARVACSGLVKACRMSCAGKCDQGVAFMCKSNKMCIPKRKLCDHVPDCDDGSDEKEALCSCRNKGVYRCATSLVNKCIPDHRRCDGYPDCDGGEDEANCASCHNNRDAFLCQSNNRCYPKSAVCNGVVDCPDYSDEDFCSCTGCKSQDYETFLCKGKSRCLKKSLMCAPNAIHVCPGDYPMDKINCDN